MSSGLGPRLIDFSPLGQLGSTFFDAYDKAKLQAYQDQAAKIYDRSLSLAGLAPQAAAGTPVADTGNVPDVLGTPKMRPPSFGLSGPIGAPAAPAPAVPAAARSLPTFAQGGAIGQYASAIQGNESGGKYDIVGPRHPKLGRALGAYQVMEANIPQWSREALGREVSAEEFLGSKEIQDAIFQHKFGQYVQKYGSPERAAAAWFSGSPNTKSGARDSLGTSVPKYVQSFAANLSKAGGAPTPDLPATQVAMPGDGTVPLPPPRPAQLASADLSFAPGYAPAASAAPQPSRPAQFLTAQAQNRAGLPTAGTEGDPATPSDFVPGSTAVPAQPPQYGQPAPGAQPVGPAPTALSLLSQAQKDNLRAMLANPVTRQHAMQIIDKLNAPEEFEIKEAGGQFYRIGKRTGQAQVIPGIAKPQEWTPHHAADGNDYLINKHTGQTKRLIEGGQFTDVTDPAELVRVRPPGYQGPVQRGPKNQLEFPGSGTAGINLQTAGEAESQKVRIKQYTDMVEEGAKARSAALDIENLRELGRGLGAQGAQAGFKEALGPFAQALDINIKGLPEIQAYQAIIKRLTPNMRPPGSGSTSNYEEKLYGQALPGLLMHPEGREMVLDVMQAGNEYAAERARIGQAAINGEISHAQAAQQLRALPDPLERFKEFRKNNPTVIRDALQAKAPTAAPPTEFKRGDTATGPDGKKLLFDGKRWIPHTPKADL